ncbi:MAG TPA: hypothetical protein VKA21_13250 [Candidatus Binatia bacterium]|nr:hypothetical protein [Candidatus Binatia bacterium]
MRTLIAFVVLAAATAAYALGPAVRFTLPVENTTPGVFGDLPYPDDLYFDQGQPGDGDGTLLNTGASIGLGVDVIRTNTASAEEALDVVEGFGTTSAIYFFLDGPLDVASLPASPVVSPSLGDSVFCADTATLTPVPIALRFDVDTRIPNVLAVLPLPGRPLAAKTAYTCVLRTAVTGGGDPIEPSADWTSVRDGVSTNGDADAIFDPVVAALGTAGVPAAAIAGMTVFTTEPTIDDLVRIRDVVLPGEPVPTADFTSRPELVFTGDAGEMALLGRTAPSLAVIATGFYGSPRFQTLDPDGNGPFHDLPIPPSFVNCAIDCETTDERFTHDGSGNPVVITTPQIPFTVTIPAGTPPAGGWPIIIQQHGLGGQRDTVIAFAEADADRGFASIGIDAVAHGYRFFDCTPAAPCSQDNANNVGGTAIPDGFVDGSVAGFSVSFLTVNLGFFQGFHNFVGIRDNFRQTYADLLQLVRLIRGHSIDGALGTTIDDTQIYYMGHSLGGLMGSGFVPIETGLKAALLNATGGGLTNQLFINSSIGGGAQALVNGILGLDPANVPDQFALQPNVVQAIVDPADGINSASLILGPAPGAPRNVIQVEDFGDQVVPNQANEALALAAGLPLFDPFVQNLHQSALSLPVANLLTPGTITGNIGGGAATAALLQNGPATHAASITTVSGTLTFVPEFAHADDYVLTMNGFPALERGINVPNAGILDEVLDWFSDIVANGPPGTFTFGGPSNFNPIQNLDAPAGPSTETFFARTVESGGALPFSEPTPDVTVAFAANVVPSRVTGGRSILGTTPAATDRDVPPGPFSAIGTPGILPFFATLQRQLAGAFAADVSVAYTTDELLRAGIPPGSSTEAELTVGRFVPGTCTVGAAACSENGDCGANGPCVGATYTVLPTAVDTANHVATASVTSFSTFAVLHPNVIAGGPVVPRVPGGGSRRSDCNAEWQVVNPTNTPFLRHDRINNNQTCTDGDPNCDADRTVDGTCTFRVSICLNQTDPALASCTPAGATALVHVYPSRRAGVLALNDALLQALVDLGGTLTGHGLTDVAFDPALAGSVCTDFALLPVAVGERPRLRYRATAASGTADPDKLRLLCSPG